MNSIAKDQDKKIENLQNSLIFLEEKQNKDVKVFKMLKKENKILKTENNNLKQEIIRIINEGKTMGSIQQIQGPPLTQDETFKENSNIYYTLKSPKTDLQFKKILDECLDMLGVNNVVSMHKIIRKYIKSQLKFIDCITNLVINCHPNNYFNNKNPSLKESWKFIKKVIEEFVSMKKNYILEEIMNIIGSKNQDNVVNDIKDIVLVNKKASKVFEALKNINNTENS